MDRRGDPASVKSEIDPEFSTGRSLALPQTIELGLLDHAAQLCNKPLHGRSSCYPTPQPTQMSAEAEGTFDRRLERLGSRQIQNHEAGLWVQV